MNHLLVVKCIGVLAERKGLLAEKLRAQLNFQEWRQSKSLY